MSKRELHCLQRGYKIFSSQVPHRNADSRWHFCALLEFSTFEVNNLGMIGAKIETTFYSAQVDKFSF